MSTIPASDFQTVAFIFKRRYSDAGVADITQRDKPTYTMITKRQGLGGQDFAYATVTGNPQGVGNTFDASRSAASPLKGEQFIATDVVKYGYLTLDGPSIRRNKANNAVFVDFVVRHVDGILSQLGSEISFDLHRDGAGLRGRRASAAGNTLTLTKASDVHYFYRGMTIIAAQNADGTSPRSGSTTVTKILRSSKQIVVADASAISSFSDNDFLFRLGQTASNGIQGMGACTPLAAPTAGVLFRQVERTNDLEALAGTRIDDPDVLPEDQIGNLAVQASLMGKKLERACVYPTEFQAMVKRLGAKIQYTSPGGQAKIGFQSIVVNAAGYAIEVMAEPDIVPAEVRAYANDAHNITYLGSTVVYLIRDDAGVAHNIGDADGLEYRAVFQGNYLQPDQAAHGVASFQSAS
jgi:hypothetical protein